MLQNKVFRVFWTITSMMFWFFMFCWLLLGINNVADFVQAFNVEKIKFVLVGLLGPLIMTGLSLLIVFYVQKSHKADKPS